ncbi:MAG: hypothetical protein CBB68_10025 [Rhodospirillaceae bacterium TMED8]|nr:cytoplasmic protein [Magnetovibrio sp.]OUT50283.1 MAG: hypothetical protein CBB68_10025 [Rhodospirillaceae bacterium TMED8]
MALPLMPKATALWLIDNSTLTFDQIGVFCGLHQLEIQALADGEVAPGMHSLDPIARGELTKEELIRCQGDPSATMMMVKPDRPVANSRSKGARYTPVSKRGDRPNAIAWLLKNYSELADAQISKLVGTTKPTINAIRDRSHWNTTNIKPQNPVGLGICSGDDLEKAISIARARAGKLDSPGAAIAPDGVNAVIAIEGNLSDVTPIQANSKADANGIAGPFAADPIPNVSAPSTSGATDLPKDPWANSE